MMASSHNLKLFVYLVVVILLSTAGIVVFNPVSASEWCSPPFLSQSDLAQPIPCRDALAGMLLQMSIDVLFFAVAILLLVLLLNWARSLRSLRLF
jgi:hypothetical protein